NSLTILYCGYNSLTSLPTLPNSLIALYCFNNNITCFPTFPYSLTDTNYFSIDPNPYNCLPNYITAMSAADLAKPLCAAGNSNGCAVAGIKQVTGINEQVSVYPNPATDILNVSLQQAQGTNASLQITDMLGNTVKQSIIYNLTSIINVGDLSEGVYNLSIASSIGVANKRLVIVK
ncbi:MAG TPA: T9SS type A sorting domain-containing protein, partial [Bacteroidia bacterium]